MYLWHAMNRSVLIVSFHFPPIQASSGVLRVLSFAKHLAGLLWDVRVVTATTGAYDSVNLKNLDDIPSRVKVLRALSLNTQKHLSIRGKYPGFLAIPDNWVTWIPFAYLVCAVQILRKRPSVVITTYPLASCHAVGWLLKRTFGIPWIADFRDPMLQDNYPKDPRQKWAYRQIEGKTVRSADLVVVTTPGTQRLLARRYGPEIAAKLRLIENGVETDVFRRAAESPAPAGQPSARRPVLLHSGIVYPYERDPTNLFAAVARARAAGLVSAQTFELRLRGCGHYELFRTKVREAGVEDLVSLLPPISYLEAAAEILDADGLLVLQASNCDDQIPAKVYEYLSTGKPILGLANPRGDTGSLLFGEGVGAVAALEDAEAVFIALAAFIAEHLQSGPKSRSREYGAAQSSRYSRDRRAEQLAAAIEELSS